VCKRQHTTPPNFFFVCTGPLVCTLALCLCCSRCRSCALTSSIFFILQERMSHQCWGCVSQSLFRLARKDPVNVIFHHDILDLPPWTSKADDLLMHDSLRRQTLHMKQPIVVVFHQEKQKDTESAAWGRLALTVGHGITPQKYFAQTTTTTNSEAAQSPSAAPLVIQDTPQQEHQDAHDDEASQQQQKEEEEEAKQQKARASSIRRAAVHARLAKARANASAEGVVGRFLPEEKTCTQCHELFKDPAKHKALLQKPQGKIADDSFRQWRDAQACWLKMHVQGCEPSKPLPEPQRLSAERVQHLRNLLK
jgi:hypothetical protein